VGVSSTSLPEVSPSVTEESMKERGPHWPSDAYLKGRNDMHVAFLPALCMHVAFLNASVHFFLLTVLFFCLHLTLPSDRRRRVTTIGPVWFVPKPTTPNQGHAKILAKDLFTRDSPARRRRKQSSDQNFGLASLGGLQSKRNPKIPLNAKI
jgi:hypothetical protein